MNKLIYVVTTAMVLSTLSASQLVFAGIHGALDQQAINQVSPLSPSSIKAFKARLNAKQRAIHAAPIAINQLQATNKTFNLSAQKTPPLIHLVSGYATNISFIGDNGHAWPIVAGVPGGKAITINPNTHDAYNATLLVNKPWVSTNVSFYLKGRVRPIIIYVYTASNPKQGLDGNVTLQIAGIPPGTSPNPVKNVSSVSNALLNTLDYAPGNGWKRVSLSNNHIPVHVNFWVSPDHKQAIVRLSGGTLVMPQWGSQASTPDHTITAYEFNHVPLNLWVDSDQGQSFQLRVSDPTSLIAGGNSILSVSKVTPELISLHTKGGSHVK